MPYIRRQQRGGRAGQSLAARFERITQRSMGEKECISPVSVCFDAQEGWKLPYLESAATGRKQDGRLCKGGSGCHGR